MKDVFYPPTGEHGASGKSWGLGKQTSFNAASTLVTLATYSPWPSVNVKETPRVNLAHGEHFQKTEHCGILKLCILTPRMLCHSSPDEDLKLSNINLRPQKGKQEPVPLGGCQEGEHRYQSHTRANFISHGSSLETLGLQLSVCTLIDAWGQFLMKKTMGFNRPW